jgi:hypothetical protein
MEVEFQHLDLRYEKLRKQDKRREAQLLGSLASHGQQMPIVVVSGKSSLRFSHEIATIGSLECRA